jgi:hypothetical protein
MAHCPHCGGLVRPERFGVAFSELKARLIDVVRRAGADGIDGDDLHNIVFGERKRGYATLKSHIW